MTEQFDVKYKDFIKICRLCCKKNNNLIPIYHKTEDDPIPAMLLKIGLNVNDKV